jgi:hypothetical protein
LGGEERGAQDAIASGANTLELVDAHQHLINLEAVDLTSPALGDVLARCRELPITAS